MDLEEEKNLIENDKDFKENKNKGNNNSNKEDLNERISSIYNPIQFQTELLINYFQNNNIFKKFVVSPKYCQQCKMVKDNQKLNTVIYSV